ncbi:hypothetical protein ACWGJQ_12400 [Peribacillus simplex]
MSLLLNLSPLAFQISIIAEIITSYNIGSSFKKNKKYSLLKFLVKKNDNWKVEHGSTRQVVETIASINGLKDVIVVKKWCSGEFGTTYYYYHMITANLERHLKQVKSKQHLLSFKYCITLREIKPVIFRTNNKAVHPNFRDTLLCCFRLGFQIGLNLGFKHLISAR